MTFRYLPEKKSLNESGGAERVKKLEAVLRALLAKMKEDSHLSGSDYEALLDLIKE